ALERSAVVLILCNDAKGTRNNAIGAAVADIGLKVNSSKFRADQRSRRTGFKAAGVLAMLADIGGESPCIQIWGVSAETGLRSIFYELDVTPGGSPQGHRVVVRVSAEVEAV